MEVAMVEAVLVSRYGRILRILVVYGSRLCASACFYLVVFVIFIGHSSSCRAIFGIKYCYTRRNMTNKNDKNDKIKTRTGAQPAAIHYKYP